MEERGGPTTQAGIRYQNSVAALYLGDLLRWNIPNPAERVRDVRLEAPVHVDDIVAKFADGHRDWIQVKLSLAPRGKAWDKLWRDFAAQRDDDQFGAEDWLVLILGTASPLAQMLVDLADRAKHGTFTEWMDRLTDDQRLLTSKLEALIPGAHRIFQRLRVERIESDRLERDFAPHRMPATSATSAQLLIYLRDLAGGDARVRGSFGSARLRQSLRSIHGLIAQPPSVWGLDVYLEAVRAMARISVPGTSSGGSCESLFLWPRVCSSDASQSLIEDEFGASGRSFDNDRIDLTEFPTAERKALIVHAGPGFGKSTLLLALSSRLTRTETVPAIIPLAALATTAKDVLGYLTTVLNQEYRVQLDWEQLSEDGSVALLFDGLDEVSPKYRAAIVRHLQVFAARFPNAAWMMTVRDPAVIPAGFDAPNYEIMPLSEADVKAFVATWRPELVPAQVDAFVERIDAHPDLAALIRIPLFLSLLLAIWDGEAALPSGRAELIEAYLKTLFRPEEHKGAPRAADPERLREAMQSLSFDLLERGEIGASERDVRKVVAARAGASVTADQLFDDALRCGLLRRQGGGRLTFPFPIVQEYLAARQLLEQHHDEIAARATRAVERPWAQVIQFALEQLPDATVIAQALLARADDAFANTARLLGRCIANGMRCEAEVRIEVGRRLVAAWPRASFWTCRRIGQLLLEGWSQPLLPELRKALHNRYLIHDGAGAILAKLADDSLNLSVLHSHIAKKISPNIGPLQELILPQSAEVFEVYLAAAHSRRRYVGELWAVAVLIRRLDPRSIRFARLREVAGDESLPDMIRLAVSKLLKGAVPLDFWDMVERGLRSRDYHRRWAARDALDCAPDCEARVIRYLNDPKIPRVSRDDIVDHLTRIFGSGDRCLAFIRMATSGARLSKTLRTKLLLWGAIIGEVELFEDLVTQVPALSSTELCIVSNMLSEYRDRDQGLRLVEALSRRTFMPPEQVEIASALMLGARYKLDRFDLRSAALEDSPPHPAIDAILALIDQWRTSAHIEGPDLLRMQTIATEAGLDGAADHLLALTRTIILEETVGGYDDAYNSPIRSALSALQDRGLTLPLDILKRLVETSNSNARIAALYMIGAVGTRAALEYLLELSRTNREDWSSILQNVEKLAARLNLVVLRLPEGLAIAEPVAVAL